MQKIEIGIAEDLRLSGITEPMFFTLSPAERQKRVEKRLAAKGLEKDELPQTRAFRRYWQKRARAGNL